MLLSQALRFLFQGKEWFRALLLLALTQLLPIVGQLILLGYGLDIVRAVYTEQTGLPPMKLFLKDSSTAQEKEEK